MATATAPADWDLTEPPPFPVYRFTVDQYHRIVRDGLLDGDDRRFELLEGWIVPMTRNPPHEVAVTLAQHLLSRRLPDGWHVRGQSALTTGDSELEADLAIVRGSIRAYSAHHPGPGDVALVVEVADSSLARDRGLKRRIYARAAVPAYWIVNLAERLVELYSEPSGPAAEPTYRQRRDLRPGEALPLALDGLDLAPVPVADLLP